MYISIDVGGTNTRVAGSESLKRPVFVGEPIRQRNGNDFEADISQIVKAVQEIGNGRIKAVGIGVTGTIDDAKTHITSSQNNPHWNSQPFVGQLERKLKCPVFMDNDAVAQALAEAYFGSVAEEFAYVAWGTGVGGVLVARDVQGKPIVDNINQDWEKHFRAWHMSCAGGELTKQHGRKPEAFTEAEWQDILQLFCDHLQTFVQQFKPEAIVFGGGLGVRHGVAIASLMKQQGSGVAYQPTRLGDDIGLYGGLAVLRDRLTS